MSRLIAYRLPRKVLYWVVIRVWADLTTRPEFSHNTPEEVTIWNALEALA